MYCDDFSNENCFFTISPVISQHKAVFMEPVPPMQCTTDDWPTQNFTLHILDTRFPGHQGQLGLRQT